MRYDKRARFIQKIKSSYDPELGRRVEAEEEVILPCNIRPVSIEKEARFESLIGKASHVVRVKHSDIEASYVLFGQKKMTVLKKVDHGIHGLAFYVSEVIKDGR